MSGREDVAVVDDGASAMQGLVHSDFCEPRVGVRKDRISAHDAVADAAVTGATN